MSVGWAVASTVAAANANLPSLSFLHNLATLLACCTACKVSVAWRRILCPWCSTTLDWFPVGPITHTRTYIEFPTKTNHTGGSSMSCLARIHASLLLPVLPATDTQEFQVPDPTAIASINLPIDKKQPLGCVHMQGFRFR